MHRKVDTKILNKLFSDSWPTDYNKIFQISRGCGLRVEGVVGRGVVGWGSSVEGRGGRVGYEGNRLIS